MTDIDYNNYQPPPPLDKLQHLEHPHEYGYWWEHTPAFIKEIGFDSTHIPDLIELSKVWAYRTEWPKGDGEMTMFAPIHAWRVLGYLKAVEAIEPLIGLMNHLDENDDDYYLEELPCVFGMIGPETIPYLKAFAVDRANNEYPRIAAWNGLSEVAQRYPETYDDIVTSINDELANFLLNEPEYNGLLVCDLLDLKAVESAELIERAYASGHVDEMVVSWESVMRELGVKGTGLIPEEDNRYIKSKPAVSLPHPIFTSAMFSTGSKGKDTKAKRKQRDKSRKRNRKKKK